MAKKFSGFEPSLFQFLEELKNNNNRDWFNENKPRYKEQVVEPMGEFINAMAPILAKLSPHFIADARPHGGSMFRIYRDARFSKDKRPYKTNVGCQFRHAAGKDAHAPGFYIHLEPGNVFIGGGLWKPPAPALENIRKAIDEKPAQWGKIRNQKNFLALMGDLRGEALKRPPRGYDADHPQIDDLKRKSFMVMRELQPDLPTTPQFLKEVEKTFKTISPFMGFLTEANDLAF